MPPLSLTDHEFHSLALLRARHHQRGRDLDRLHLALALDTLHMEVTRVQMVDLVRLGSPRLKPTFLSLKPTFLSLKLTFLGC